MCQTDKRVKRLRRNIVKGEYWLMSTIPAVQEANMGRITI
jgi:hypothetical protein